MTVRFYVIQDVITKGYLYINGDEEDFDKDLSSARKFHYRSDAEDKLDWLDREYMEIKTYYKKELI